MPSPKSWGAVYLATPGGCRPGSGRGVVVRRAQFAARRKGRSPARRSAPLAWRGVRGGQARRPSARLHRPSPAAAALPLTAPGPPTSDDLPRAPRPRRRRRCRRRRPDTRARPALDARPGHADHVAGRPLAGPVCLPKFLTLRENRKRERQGQVGRLHGTSAYSQLTF